MVKGDGGSIVGGCGCDGAVVVYGGDGIVIGEVGGGGIYGGVEGIGFIGGEGCLRCGRYLVVCGDGGGG